MGIYYSLVSVFSPSTSTSTHNANVHSANRLEHRIRSKSLKKRRRRHKRHHLLNRFFLGSNHFSVNAQPHTCLFHEYYTLNSSRETLQPVHLQLSLPESNRATVLSPIQCSMAIRRDSLKLIHHTEDSYSIDFTFDADRPFQLYSKSSSTLALMYLCFLLFQSISWRTKRSPIAMDLCPTSVVQNSTDQIRLNSVMHFFDLLVMDNSSRPHNMTFDFLSQL